MISIGIDIAKLTFEAAKTENDKVVKMATYQYDKTGMTKFSSDLQEHKAEVLISMEATGRYHLRLAEYLDAAGFKVSVINPLVIKRYGQMKLRRTKTDKADAILIAEYGAHEKPAIFKPISPERRKILEIITAIDNLILMKVQISGQLEAFNIMPVPCQEVIVTLQENLSQIKKSIKKLEMIIQEIIKTVHKQTYELLLSSPGFGKRIGALVVGMFGDFDDFIESGQVACFIGLTPFEKRSGTSLSWNGYISKKGNPYARKLFFLGAFSAVVWNSHCRSLYQNFIARGKSKKVALVAVAHKLVRIAFGVVKSKKPFDSNYESQRKIA
jgi:transposase